MIPTQIHSQKHFPLKFNVKSNQSHFQGCISAIHLAHLKPHKLLIIIHVIYQIDIAFVVCHTIPLTFSSIHLPHPYQTKWAYYVIWQITAICQNTFGIGNIIPPRGIQHFFHSYCTSLTLATRQASALADDRSKKM